MNKIGKGIAVILVLAVISQTGAAALTELDIVNVFPDQEQKDRDTHVIIRADADSTTTTDVTLWITVPNGTQIRDGTEMVRVKSGAPLERELQLDKQNLAEFGEYKLFVNDTDSGINDSVNITIIPSPQVSIDIGDLVKEPGEENLDYIHVNVNPRVGNPIGTDELQALNLTVYRITGNSSTRQGVEKELFSTQTPGISNETGDIEDIIDFSDAPQGSYSVLVEFNITSCGPCPSFQESEAVSVRVRDNATLTLANQLTLVLTVLAAAGLFLFIAFRLGRRNEETPEDDRFKKWRGVLKLFYLAVGQLFIIAALFVAGELVRDSSAFTYLSPTLNELMLASIFIVITFIFILVLMYVKTSTETAVGEERFDWEDEV